MQEINYINGTSQSGDAIITGNILADMALKSSSSGWTNVYSDVTKSRPISFRYYPHSAFAYQNISDLTSEIETEDVATQTTLLNREEKKVQELIYHIKADGSIPYKLKLADKLLALFNDAKEDELDSLGIRFESLRNFWNFLQLNPELRLPNISLTPDNNVYASWRGEQGRLLSVHFLSDNNVRFVVFKPNRRHPGRKIRFSGTSTIDVLMETAMPNSTDKWIKQ